MTGSTEPQWPKLMRAIDAAMKAEGVNALRRVRVLNRLIHGDPHPGRRMTDEITIHITGPQPGSALAAETARHRTRAANYSIGRNPR